MNLHKIFDVRNLCKFPVRDSGAIVEHEHPESKSCFFTLVAFSTIFYILLCD